MIEESLLRALSLLWVGLHQHFVRLMEFLAGTENAWVGWTCSGRRFEWHASGHGSMPVIEVNSLILNRVDHGSVRYLEAIGHSLRLQLRNQRIGRSLVVLEG